MLRFGLQVWGALCIVAIVPVEVLHEQGEHELSPMVHPYCVPHAVFHDGSPE